MGQYPPYWNAWGSWTLLAFGKLVFHPNCSLLRYGTMRLWEVVHIKRCGLTFEEIDTKVTLFFNKLFWSLTSFWQDNIAEKHNSHFLFSSFISLLYCFAIDYYKFDKNVTSKWGIDMEAFAEYLVDTSMKCQSGCFDLRISHQWQWVCFSKSRSPELIQLQHSEPTY